LEKIERHLRPLLAEKDAEIARLRETQKIILRKLNAINKALRLEVAALVAREEMRAKRARRTG